MKPKTYIETTIVSYLTARPSRDLITAAHQQITRDWWDTRRDDFELFISQVVIDEASAGDPDAAARRLAVLEQIPVLEPNAAIGVLIKSLVKEVPLPPKAADDAAHIAFSVVNGMDYLLTWNCTHIANAVLRGGIEAVCRGLGYLPPIICTPEQLLKH
ncbi:MAG TPA: type II toxin-antitoxin system VapC family toxin [Pirellulales bacterium]|jgi:hypothetical protein|nr:type II toxin-antitoxin system VapC family toxin [Pirellulales bacterium]